MLDGGAAFMATAEDLRGHGARPPPAVRKGGNVLDAPRCETLVATVSRWSLILQPDSYA